MFKFLQRTRNNKPVSAQTKFSRVAEGIKSIFTNRTVDSQSLQMLEELLISADLGVETAEFLIKRILKRKLTNYESIRAALQDEITQILLPLQKSLSISHNPHVVLFCGVNGNGKTTNLGKLAHRYSGSGKKVMIAAADTFRAAATEQLSVWSERAGCVIVSERPGADPASVAYRALQRAKDENFDLLLIDTAGRLHTASSLMDQLSKIERVLKKIDDSAPHNVFLVLDATVGQNAHNQLEMFKDAININGLIITKLDGTAKGGVLVSLARKYAVPIYFIGLGESIEDLREFNAESFAAALVGIRVL
jgi:fused signal recognition particle receptor